jgi:hypothetical protein
MFEHGTYPPSFGPHNGEREAVLTSHTLAVSHRPPGAGPSYLGPAPAIVDAATVAVASGVSV